MYSIFRQRVSVEGEGEGWGLGGVKEGNMQHFCARLNLHDKKILIFSLHNNLTSQQKEYMSAKEKSMLLKKYSEKDWSSDFCVPTGVTRGVVRDRLGFESREVQNKSEEVPLFCSLSIQYFKVLALVNYFTLLPVFPYLCSTQ